MIVNTHGPNIGASNSKLDIKEQIAPDTTVGVDFNMLLLLADYVYEKLMNKH